MPLPRSGDYIDSTGNTRNLDGGPASGQGLSFNGDFLDSTVKIRNIDSLGGGGGVCYSAVRKRRSGCDGVLCRAK